MKGKERKKNGLAWKRRQEEGVSNVMTLWFPLQFIFLTYMKIRDPLFFWIVLQDVSILQKTEMFEKCLVFSSLTQNIKYVHINNIKLQAILMADLVLKKWFFFSFFECYVEILKENKNWYVRPQINLVLGLSSSIMKLYDAKTIVILWIRKLTLGSWLLCYRHAVRLSFDPGWCQ